MDPGTASFPARAFPQTNRGAHTITAFSAEYDIASVHAREQLPGLLPPAASRLATSLSRVSCRDASGPAKLMSARRRADAAGAHDIHGHPLPDGRRPAGLPR
jgi:hypothetical protein